MAKNEAEPMDTGGAPTVVAEIPVFFKRDPASQLYLIQHPLQPAGDAEPYTHSRLEGIRWKPKNHMREVTYARTTDDYYRYKVYKDERKAKARDTDGDDEAEEEYGSDEDDGTGHGTVLHEHEYEDMSEEQRLSTIDTTKFVLESSFEPPLAEMCAGVMINGELHLRLLDAQVQMRPSLRHLDEKDAAMSETNTEAPVVEQAPVGRVAPSFQRRENERSAAARQRSFTYRKQLEESEQWMRVQRVESKLAAGSTVDAGRIMCVERDVVPMTLSADEYRAMRNPVKRPHASTPSARATAMETSEQPLTRRRLETMSLHDQVHAIVRHNHVTSLARVMRVASKATHEREVLELLRACCVLVRGRWVVKTSVLKLDARKRALRDFILLQFALHDELQQKDITQHARGEGALVRELLGELATRSRDKRAYTLKDKADARMMQLYPELEEAERELVRREDDIFKQLHASRLPKDVGGEGAMFDGSTPEAQSDAFVRALVSARGVMQLDEIVRHVVLAANKMCNDGAALTRVLHEQGEVAVVHLVEASVCSLDPADATCTLRMVNLTDQPFDRERRLVAQLLWRKKSVRRNTVQGYLLEEGGEELSNNVFTKILKELATCSGTPTWYLKDGSEAEAKPKVKKEERSTRKRASSARRE